MHPDDMFGRVPGVLLVIHDADDHRASGIRLCALGDTSLTLRVNGVSQSLHRSTFEPE